MKKFYHLLALAVLLSLHLFLLLNLRFTAWPEMFSYPFLLNRGFTGYKDFVLPYPPLLPLALSFLYKIFGYRVEILKIITWSLVLFNDTVVFLIVKKFTKNNVYALFSVSMLVILQPFLDGDMLWFDLAIVTPILLGIYFLQYSRYKWIFLSGFFFGLAVLIKQTSIIFLVISFFYLIQKEQSLKNVMVFLFGPILLGIALLVGLFITGTFTDFLNWVIVFPLKYWSKFPGYVQFDLNRNQIIILSLLILPVLVFIIKLKKYFLTILFLTSLLLIYPRFSFFHFQLATVILTILYGVIIEKFNYSKYIFIGSVIMVLLLTLNSTMNSEWRKETRFYSSQEFNLSNKISQVVDKDKSVYLLNLPSNLYVFSGRLPPKPWIDNYGWYFEMPNEEDYVISGWRQNPPDKVIWKDPDNGNWFDIGTYQPSKVTGWIKNNYTKTNEISKGVWVWKYIVPKIVI